MHYKVNKLPVIAVAAAAAVIITGIVLLVRGCTKDEENDDDVPVVEKFLPLGFDTELFRVDSTKVRRGETFTTLMTRLGMSPDSAYVLSRRCDSVFDARKVVLGAPVQAYYADSLSVTPQYVVYTNSRIRRTVFRTSDSLAVWTYDKPVEHERKFADVTINVSLWNDMLQEGISPILIMDLADIYQWSVNFFTLQKGDRFRVIYDQSVCEGEVMSIDTVHFSLFESGPYQVPAVRFDTEKTKGNNYWGKDGESLKKMFLKAPLRYNRISSGFSYHRRHPITGKVKAHTGVDYAAPKGTPVHAIGDGIVTKCGWDNSGGGKWIKIKHVQGYESSYMHLSGFTKGIHSGVRVSQGQLIGYVGSTGSSTGPHLDFRIWLKGRPINPLKLNSPASDPLPKKYAEDFERIYQGWMKEVDSLTVK